MSEGFILTVNAGSSSIKFAVFTAGDSPDRILNGQVERIGNPDAQLIAKRVGTAEEDRHPIRAETHQKAAESVAADQSRITIRIIPTDEEIVIVRMVRSMLRHSGSSQKL